MKRSDLSGGMADFTFLDCLIVCRQKWSMFSTCAGKRGGQSLLLLPTVPKIPEGPETSCFQPVNQSVAPKRLDKRWPFSKISGMPHLAVAHAVCILHLPFSIHFPFEEPQKR